MRAYYAAVEAPFALLASGEEGLSREVSFPDLDFIFGTFLGLEFSIHTNTPSSNSTRIAIGTLGFAILDLEDPLQIASF